MRVYSHLKEVSMSQAMNVEIAPPTATADGQNTTAPETICDDCERLWVAFRDATMAHVRAVDRKRRAELERDSDRLARLSAAVRDEDLRREEARDALADTGLKPTCYTSDVDSFIAAFADGA
jgi:hypothetical protein